MVAVAPALLLVVGAPASAHEVRGGGPIRFVVGWGDEPTYTGVLNSVQVTVTEANGLAVTDIGDTLGVEVIKGAERVTLPLVANFRVGGAGIPGDYRAWLTPTRPGVYTFRLNGTVRGTKVDESFASSKTTFNEVEDANNIAFPTKDPSNGQLATRIDREIPRFEEALREAENRANGARALGGAGVLAGVVGVLTALVSIVTARRATRSTAPRASAHPVSEMSRPNA